MFCHATLCLNQFHLCIAATFCVYLPADMCREKVGRILMLRTRAYSKPLSRGSRSSQRSFGCSGAEAVHGSLSWWAMMFCHEYRKLEKNTEGKMVCRAEYFPFLSIVRIVFGSYWSRCVNEVQINHNRSSRRLRRQNRLSLARLRLHKIMIPH